MPSARQRVVIFVNVVTSALGLVTCSIHANGNERYVTELPIIFDIVMTDYRHRLDRVFHRCFTPKFLHAEIILQFGRFSLIFNYLCFVKVEPNQGCVCRLSCAVQANVCRCRNIVAKRKCSTTLSRQKWDDISLKILYRECHHYFFNFNQELLRWPVTTM